MNAYAELAARFHRLGVIGDALGILQWDTATTMPAAASDARVTVHDLAGRRIATLWSGPVSMGRTSVTWDGRGAGGTLRTPGLYLIRCEIGGVRLTRRVVALR